MTRDFMLALGIIAVSTVLRVVLPNLYELLLSLGRPVGTVVVLLSIAGLWYKNYHLSALLAGVLSTVFLRDLWTGWVRSDARRLVADIGRDLDRFDPSKSIDLQFANGSAKFDAPYILTKPHETDMLVFPPSPETLAEMSG
jgi:hypothetical protein